MTPTVILTRPKAQSASFAAKLRAAWDGPIAIVIAPLIKIVPVDVTCRMPDAVIFTSANGVSAAERLGLPIGLTAWCVGSKTAGLARAAGFATITGPGDADGLVADIIADKPTGVVAHIRGTHTRGNVSARLNAAGITCTDVVAYDQTVLGLTDEAISATSAQNSVVFPLFSPRTAKILSNEGPFAAHVHVVALSEAVKAAVSPTISREITLAASPDGNAMLSATLTAMQAQIGRG
ncbi:uroporphyrinogen-III synthase [Yoonia sp. GPGPB17]|uniref:uroporphyrinogen-III synthase n=1 Tax=Yoonia sp. GPGPB17 TaxID=3026147 RepID=UPI0030C2B184